MKNLKYFYLLTASLLFVNCNDIEDVDLNVTEPMEPAPELTAGSADFSNYVSLGNSLTAGFTDGALFQASQTLSFPNILSQKFAVVGGGSFTQPLTNDNLGGLALAGTRIQDPRLVFGGAGPVGLESLIGPVTVTTDIALNNPTGPFNNLGVPGAKSFHLLAPGYGNLANVPLGLANPFFVRMTGSTPDASVLELAVGQSPSFFSLWIGNNDVLGYATTGGDGTNPLTPVNGAPGVGFDGSYGALIATLTAGGAQGVVANIPNVIDIPHFTTVPHNPLDPTNPDFGSQIATLNGIFGQLNQVYAFLETQGIPNATDRQIVFATDAASEVVIKDDNLPDLSAQIAGVFNASPAFPLFVQSFGLPAEAAPLVAGLLGNIYGQTREATPEDLLVLPSASIIGNTIIEASANAAGLALVDANGLLNQLANGGITSGDFTLTSSLVTGSAFSLDGIHPTARGYALLANEFMKAIDATYGSNFEASGNLVNVGDYPTNYSPALQ